MGFQFSTPHNTLKPILATGVNKPINDASIKLVVLRPNNPINTAKLIGIANKAYCQSEGASPPSPHHLQTLTPLIKVLHALTGAQLTLG